VELTSFLEWKSPRFREWWSSHEVASSLDCQKELVHPVAGTLYLNSVHFESTSKYAENGRIHRSPVHRYCQENQTVVETAAC
jgi:MmyB-like transcription regulator ligand binding domain